MYINYIIKSRHYIKIKKVKNKRKGVYNICLVAKLIGTILYTDRVIVLVKLNRNYRYYKYKIAFNQ